MNKEELLKKLIAEDPAIEAEIAAVTDEAGLKEIFAKRGCELTTEELDELFAKATTGFDGELSEDEMDRVAGGLSLAQIKAAWRVGARIGMGGRMLYDYLKTGNAQATYTFKQLAKGSIF